MLKGKGEAAKAGVSRNRTTPVWKGDGKQLRKERAALIHNISLAQKSTTCFLMGKAKAGQTTSPEKKKNHTALGKDSLAGFPQTGSQGLHAIPLATLQHKTTLHRTSPCSRIGKKSVVLPATKSLDSPLVATAAAYAFSQQCTPLALHREQHPFLSSCEQSTPYGGAQTTQLQHRGLLPGSAIPTPKISHAIPSPSRGEGTAATTQLANCRHVC